MFQTYLTEPQGEIKNPQGKLKKWQKRKKLYQAVRFLIGRSTIYPHRPHINLEKHFGISWVPVSSR